MSLMHIAERYCILFDHEFKGRAVFLKDIEKLYGGKFPAQPQSVSIERLIDYCEFLYNITVQVGKIKFEDDEVDQEIITKIKEHIEQCAEIFGYTRINRNDLAIFVEANNAALSVAELSNGIIAEKTLEYNHHRLKGDLNAKLDILKRLVDDIEPQRRALDKINDSLSNSLFQMLNKFVRHSHEKTPFISTLSDLELEKIYDDIYQLWLLAKLELDNIERKKQVSALLNSINS